MVNDIVDLGDGHKIESGNMINEETGLLIDPRFVLDLSSESVTRAMRGMHTTATFSVFNLIRHTFHWGMNPLPVLRRKFKGFDWKFVPYFPASGKVEMDWNAVRCGIKGTDLVWCADASGVVTATLKVGGGKEKPLVITYARDPFFPVYLADVSTLSVEVTPGEASCVLK